MDYIAINNYSKLGKIGISRNALKTIVTKAVLSIPGAEVAQKPGTKPAKEKASKPKKPRSEKSKKVDSALEALFRVDNAVRITRNRDGIAIIYINVALDYGVKVAEICLRIQKEVATAIEMMCEGIKSEVHVKVVKVG